MSIKERERELERERATERDRETDRERERETERETETERDRETKRENTLYQKFTDQTCRSRHVRLLLSSEQVFVRQPLDISLTHSLSLIL